MLKLYAFKPKDDSLESFFVMESTEDMARSAVDAYIDNAITQHNAEQRDLWDGADKLASIWTREHFAEWFSGEYEMTVYEAGAVVANLNIYS